MNSCRFQEEAGMALREGAGRRLGGCEEVGRRSAVGGSWEVVGSKVGQAWEEAGRKVGRRLG